MAKRKKSASSVSKKRSHKSAHSRSKKSASRKSAHSRNKSRKVVRAKRSTFAAWFE